MKKVSLYNLAGYSGFSFVLVYLFYYLERVDVSLSYTWQQTIPFSFGDALKNPGGVSQLLADLILEITTRPIWGSVLIALLTVLVFFSLKTLFKRESSTPLYFPLLLASLVPFTVLFAYYRLPFELLCSFALALFLAMTFGIYKGQNLAVGAIYNFISAIVIFVLTGAPGLMVLMQVIIVNVVYSKSYRDLVRVLPLLFVPLLYLPFNLALSVKQVFLGPLLASKYDEIPLVLYFSLFSPFMLLMGFSIVNFVFAKLNKKPSFLVSWSSMIIVMAAMVYFSLSSINETEKNGYSIFESGYNRDWAEVLKLSKETAYINQVLQFEINRALYGSGILLDEMFSYPQQFAEKGIFLEGISSSRVSVHTAAFYYDLGFANEARHWANEAQMVLVRHPVVLKQLIMSYLAIGQVEVAERYLQVLSGSRLYRDWCGHVRSMIDNKQLGEDPDVQFFRANNPAYDFFAGTSNPLQKLSLFYRNNPDNNAAFEFLAASYLLQHNLGALVSLLPQFKKQGHEVFPKAVEEALMIYITKNGRNTSSLTDYAISKTTVDEFRDFNKLMADADTMAEKMKRVSKYKNTYWYYILFSSPYAKK